MVKKVVTMKGRFSMGRKGESIYKRNDGRWEARYYKVDVLTGNKALASVYAASYTEAKNKRNLAAQLNTSCVTPKNASNLTLNAVLNGWLEFNRNHIKASSYQKYEGLIRNHIQNTIGKRLISDISRTVILEYAQEQLLHGNIKQGGPLSPKTVNSILMVITAAIEWDSEASFSCSFKIPFIKDIRPSPQTFTHYEQNKLEAYIKSNINGYTLGILIALYTGMRIGEICALEWIDISENSIYVHKTMQRIRTGKGKWEVAVTEPKTACSHRDIPICPCLSNYLKYFTRSSGYILLQSNGKFIEPRLLQKQFEKILKEIGLPQKTFHSLRHTFATRMIDVGCDPKTVSEVLGHSNVQITLNRYVHPSFEMKKKAINKIGLQCDM